MCCCLLAVSWKVPPFSPPFPFSLLRSLPPFSPPFPFSLLRSLPAFYPPFPPTLPPRSPSLPFSPFLPIFSPSLPFPPSLPHSLPPPSFPSLPPPSLSHRRDLDHACSVELWCAHPRKKRCWQGTQKKDTK